MGKNSRDYQYKVLVKGQELLSGDAHSTGIVFGNLHGRNFDRRSDPATEHAAWLNYMAKEMGMLLSPLDEIKLIAPEGHLLQVGCISTGIPRTDPELGQFYMVKTSPIGGVPEWWRAQHVERSPASATRRELFYFKGDIGCYPVTRVELMDRVMPA